MRRIAAVLFVIAGLLLGTGFVMEKVRRNSLFLDARDDLTAGRPPAEVLERLDRSIDWPALPEEEGRALARLVDPGRPDASPRVHRAGDWALLTFSDSRILATRTRRGWETLP